MSYWNFMPSQEKIVIVNVRIFDGTAIKGPRSVHIAEGKIEAITEETTYPKASETEEFPVFAHGAILIPGLIDSHVHLLGVEQLDQLRMFGVTSAVDMATFPLTLLNALRGIAGTNGLPDLKTCGVGACMDHPGFPDESMITDEASAEAFVSTQVAQGADFIKVVLDVDKPPFKSFDPKILRKLVQEAKRHRKLSVCHACAMPSYSEATEAGFDIVTHGPMESEYTGEPNQQEVLNKMYNRHAVVIPTVINAQSMVDRFAAAGPNGVEYVKSWVRAIHDKGIKVLAGTDSNAASGTPGHPLHGESLHCELEYLVESGLTPTEALLAATKWAADVFGFDKRGEIKVGNVADLVLLADNPLEDIRNTRMIKQVWVAGLPVLPLRSLQVVPQVPWGYGLQTRYVQDQHEKKGGTVVKPAPCCD